MGQTNKSYGLKVAQNLFNAYYNVYIISINDIVLFFYFFVIMVSSLVIYNILLETMSIMAIIVLTEYIFLTGLICFVQYLSQDHIPGKEQPLKIILDAGTGTTAVGLAIRILCLGYVLII